MESLGRLPTVFKKGGIVTAGTASGICDGGAANIVVSEEALKRFGIKPLAKVLSYHVVAVEPSIMGIGPVEAIRGALKKAGLTIEQIDLFDVSPFVSSTIFLLQTNHTDIIVQQQGQRSFCCTMAFSSEGTWITKRQDQRFRWCDRFVFIRSFFYPRTNLTRTITLHFLLRFHNHST